MKSFLIKELNEATTDGARERPITGLHDADVGDYIMIGIEGQRQKLYTKIVKIVANDRLQDKDGNIFGRDGKIYRRKGYLLKNTTDSIVSNTERIGQGYVRF